MQHIERSLLSFTAGAMKIHTPWESEADGHVAVNGEEVQGCWEAGADGSSTCRHGPWELTVRGDACGAYVLDIRNADAVHHRLDMISLARWRPDSFTRPLNTAEFRELVHGGSFLSVNSGVRCVGRSAPGLGADTPGGMLTVYQREGGGALLLGILPPTGSALSEFHTLHSDPHLEGTFGFEVRQVFRCMVAPGARQTTSPVVAMSGASGTDLLAEYGRLWYERLERKPAAPPKTGWNSWDFASGAVTREFIDRNIAAAHRLFGDTLEVFAIDEGWECQWGTWAPNWKFPQGLEDYCRHVRANGYTPGVWTAPLLVNTYNPLFSEHPDWFAGRADGQLQTDAYSYGPMAYLDVTRPEVIEHIKSVFARLRTAGFEYFKVDFCQCILKAERFHDPEVGRNDLVRRAFQAIREAIGEDAYLLGCGAPYESVVGLVDAVRSTGDIHIYWGHVLRNAGPLSVRWWMQGNLWNCDPDFLVVRGPETAEPPYGKRRVVSPAGPEGGWMAGREFDAMEARTYALLVHLSGGDVILGDSLPQLTKAGLDMLRRVLRPRIPAAVPVDLFASEQDLPRIWVSRGANDTLVGIFNWTDKCAAMPFRAEQWDLRTVPHDFWTGDPVQTLPEWMPRRSSLALLYEEVTTPEGRSSR